MPIPRKSLLWVAGAGITGVCLCWRAWLGDGPDHSRVYRIGYGEDVPLHFQGTNGQPHGLAVDLVRAAAARRGIQLQWVHGKGLAEANTDFWVLMTILPDRLKTLHLTAPYLQTRTCFVVPDRGSARELKDLETSRISFLDFAIHRRALDRMLPRMRPVPASSSRAALEAMLLGQSDAAFIDEYAAMPALLNGTFSTPLRLIPANVADLRMGIASTRETSAVADEIRHEMRKMAEDGSINRITESWGFFPNLTTDMIKEVASTQRWTRRYAGAAAALLAMLGLTAAMLARMRIQTGQLRRAQAELQGSEERFRRLVEQASEGVELLDETGRFVDANTICCEQLGYDKAELLRMRIQDVDPSLGPDRYRALFTASRGRPALRLESARQRKDGSRFPVELSVSVIDLREGPRALFLARDISERKQTEDALRENKERLQDTARLAKVGGWEIDLATETLAWTEETCRIHELPTGAAPSVAEALQYYHPDDRAAVTSAVRRAMETGEGFDFEARLITAQRRPLWVRASGKMVSREGRPIRVRGMIQDITDLKVAGEEMRKAMLIVENIPTGLHLYHLENVDDDRTLRMVYANPAVEGLTGVAPEDVIGRTVDECFPSLRERGIPRRYAEVVRTQVPIAFDDFVYRDDRIPVAVFSVKAFPLPAQHVGVAFENITERKRAEAEREMLQAQLTQAQKMESVGRLAGGVAHDFNNMLQAILGNTALALMDLALDSPLRGSLEEIEKSALRSADLTRQLLAFARKQTIAPKVIDLNDAVTGMLKMLRRLIGEDIELAWLPGPNVGPVYFDPSQVDQILANLCVNARDAIGGGGGKVTIETENVLCDATYVASHPEARAAEYARLTVSDTGCGMTSEVRAHLFEPFYTTKGVGHGTGLGLATVYGIVRQNDGFIRVYSEPGQGATFQVHLPCHSATPSTPATEIAASPPARGQETILLVEDEPSLLSVNTRLLESLGYTVLAAARPAEALRLAREQGKDVDLLVTDVIMPGMNGRDLARMLLEQYPGLKRLFTSGYTANVIAHHGVLDPGVHFLQKPFSLQALAAKVREALNGG